MSLADFVTVVGVLFLLLLVPLQFIADELEARRNERNKRSS
jgi:inner membrane protein involved in colicin E2 resistance